MEPWMILILAYPLIVLSLMDPRPPRITKRPWEGWR